MPTKAGIQELQVEVIGNSTWIPTFAGMTLIYPSKDEVLATSNVRGLFADSDVVCKSNKAVISSPTERGQG